LNLHTIQYNKFHEGKYRHRSFFLLIPPLYNKEKNF
jgi:hypothetical protein